MFREILRATSLQQVLQNSWSRIFYDNSRGVVSALEGLDVDTRDRLRLGIYELLDWIVAQAVKGNKISKKKRLSASTR